MTTRPRRSVLYMPGSNARAIEKARSLAADAIILDLEDSVAPEAKSAARMQVAHNVAAGGFGPREVVVRINGLDTEWWLDDLAAIAHAKPDAILLPKISSPDQFEVVIERLVSIAASHEIRLWAMMRLGFTPDINALVAIILALTTALCLIAARHLMPRGEAGPAG